MLRAGTGKFLANSAAMGNSFNLFVHLLTGATGPPLLSSGEAIGQTQWLTMKLGT